MPLLPLTKGQKKAAKRAVKKQSASATKEAPLSNVEYALVNTIEPERLDLPAIAFTPTQESATSTRNVAVSHPEHYSLMSYENIVAASSLPTASQQLPPSSTDVTGSQSSGLLPTLSALPLESLGSFNDTFTFAAPTSVVTFGKSSNVTDVSKHEYASSLSQDVEDIEDEGPTSLAFSKAFVEDLRSPTFTTAAASTRAFEEALSRNSDVTESSIFTRLRDATTATTSGPAFIECAGTNVEKKPEVSSDCANQERALVRYCTLKTISLVADYEVDQGLDETSTNFSLDSILPHRMFLASADGVIQCIAYDQLLHDVETVKDDGGSDFDSVASPSKGYLEHFGGAHDETSKSIDSRIEDAPLNLGIRNRLHDVEESASIESLEVPGWSLQPTNKDWMDRAEVWSYADGSEKAASVSTEKCEVSATQQGRLQSATCSDSKEEFHDPLQSAGPSEESVKAVFYSSEVPEASASAREPSHMRLGTESSCSFREALEAEESGKVTRDAVITAFLKLVNIERKKRGVHALPSLYTAHSVLSSGILPHTIMLGTTTVASFTAQLSFDEKDEVEMGDVCAAWDRLDREEVGRQQMASGGIMGALGRALGRLGGSYLEK
ncbi:uncharacterized protein J4E84_000210 [Alternaria hordeiaustralica]|uniref:uncharacterized protein n=1 Tax=Alternaria hordeiaustralica TaxID=1187925 RepID=UPI0020C45C4E|nr:uncharacterized protein J4E84_000210 [Alternaria hordeiaustralica]KAI4697085.1 hypothetical protein J4E84_000210 [Alternaria hordeiaustralica]